MDLIIIILFCCCCCIILSGGGYFYITNSSSKITSAQSTNTLGKLPATSGQIPNTLGQSNPDQLSNTSGQIPNTLGQSNPDQLSNTSGQSQNTSNQTLNTSGQSDSDQSQITTTIKPTTTTTTTPIPVIKWVICGSNIENLPAIAYSYDGKLWTQSKSIISKTGSFQSIAYNGKIWIATGPTDFKIASSTDGITWTLNKYESSYCNAIGICWGGSLWVIVGTKRNPQNGGYYGSIITSKDGSDWSEIKGDFPILRSVKYNPDINVWVAAGAEKMVLYSKDGIEWEKINVMNLGFHYNEAINFINVINSQFLATVRTNNGNMISSSGGKIWKSFNHIRITSPEKIISFNNIMIVGGTGDFHLGYSLDQGITWVGSVSSDGTNNVTGDIATNNSDIVLAVGYFINRTENKMLGQILTSTNGKNWTVSKVAFMSRINGIASNIPL